MDSAPHSWITPTTCFSIACVAFSLVAASTVWRNQQSVSTPRQKKVDTKLQRADTQPQRRLRVAVDSLYAESGDELYEKIANTVNAASETHIKSPDDVVFDLVSKCAQMSRQLRAFPVLQDARVSMSALLGEMLFLTTVLCRVQQLLSTVPDVHSLGSAKVACFEAAIRGVSSTLEALETDLKLSCLHAGSIDEGIRRLRDQRPAFDFLLEGHTALDFPPTPPSEAATAATLNAPGASQHALLKPSIFQDPTGLTPSTESKSWIDPPPEYSPAADGTQLVGPEKSTAKLTEPSPPEPQTEEQDEDRDTDALYNAVTQDDIGLVNDLLTLLANPNEVIGDLQRTPLHQAAHLNHVGCLSALLRSGAVMSTEDIKGDTPLHLAAWAGHVEALHSLLAHGADVDWLSGRDGYSPLWCAISAYHIDAARLLLKQGARVSLRSAAGGGLTPLHQAAVTGQSAMCELLLERGAQVDAVDDDQNTPLHYAAASGSTPSVQILLRNGAQVDLQQSQGLTPLHWAAHKGHTEVLCMLLAYGAPVNAQAEEGATPLHLAANRGHVPAVRALLEKGANKKLKAVWDGSEGVAWQMAKAKGHSRAARALQAK